MYKLEYEFHNNVPVFKCNFCGHCGSFIESTSYTSIKTRGCCWYFPKYTLMDIKNIIDMGNKNFIHKILNMKNCKISKYHLELTGEFNEDKYKDFLKSDSSYNSDFDNKLFFRLCPFATSSGCSIDFNLRPHPCNLYLCRGVISMCGIPYEIYSKERKDYFSYCNYFSEHLKYILMDEKVNFLENPFKTIDILEQIEIPKFSPRDLPPISFNSIPSGDKEMVI